MWLAGGPGRPDGAIFESIDQSRGGPERPPFRALKPAFWGGLGTVSAPPGPQAPLGALLGHIGAILRLRELLPSYQVLVGFLGGLLGRLREHLGTWGGLVVVLGLGASPKYVGGNHEPSSAMLIAILEVIQLPTASPPPRLGCEL